jgi:hypothetical protein
MHRPLRHLAFVALVPGLLWTGPALAWGSSGHRLVTQAAVESLPEGLPDFMRQPVFAVETAEIARDPDRIRGSGRAYDSDGDPAHFIDGDDEGRALGGPLIAALPPTREDYDAALRAVGSDSWRAGYLPYAIIEGWQRLVKDLALWRGDSAGVRLTTDPAHKAWLEADRARRELLIRADLGIWSHFVGDASYPLHVSVHYNGWGKGPNPDGFTQEHIHVPLEGPYVAQHVTLAAAKAQMAPYRACGCAIDARVGQYLSASMGLVRPLYALEKAGGFKAGDARGVTFLTERIAVGADELRDMIVDAWNASDRVSIGYPTPVVAADVEAGKAGDPYLLLHGND